MTALTLLCCAAFVICHVMARKRPTLYTVDLTHPDLWRARKQRKD